MKIIYEKSGWCIAIDQDSEWQKVFSVTSYGVYVFRPELKNMGYSGWSPVGQKISLYDCCKMLVDKKVLTQDEANNLTIQTESK